jgi:proteasome lid subunit RPN8/RPN11
VTLSIGSTVVEALVAHARAAHPRECCGLLIGTRDRIVRAWPAANLAERPTRYLIDPRDHFAALRAARAESLEVVGAYHSHPAGPAHPSPTDVAESLDSSLVHVIIAGTNDPEIRAFLISEGNFRQLVFVTEP